MFHGIRWSCFVAGGLIAMVCVLPGVMAQPDQDRALANWHQWRGPLGTGVAPGGNPPVQWGEDKNVQWKVAVSGMGHSTPIIWENRIFLTTVMKTEVPVDSELVLKARERIPDWMKESGVPPAWVMKFAVLAIDRATGKLLWTRVVRESAPHEGLHSDSSWASNSAVTDGEVVVAHFGSNGTYCLGLDGADRWAIDLGDMTTRRGFGEGSSPAIHGDTVVINWDHEGPSFIVALDKKTGKTRWKKERDEVTSWSTPVIVEIEGNPQVVVNATNWTRGYDLKTGEVLWEASGMTVNTIPSPVFRNGRVFVASGYRGSLLLAIDLLGAKGDITGTDAVAWGYRRDTPYVPSLLLSEDRIYFLKANRAILSCLDAVNGEILYRRKRIEEIASIYASPVAADGKIYLLGRDGSAVVVKDGSKFEILARNSLEDRFDASPAIVGHEMFLRGHKFLYCISESGEALGRD